MTTIHLFTRDLRCRDNPGLASGAQAGPVVPLFVLDDDCLRLHTGRHRMAFLLESLHDLRRSLRARGGDLVLRRGDPAECIGELALATGADRVHVSDDVSAFSARRKARIDARLAADPRTAHVATELFPGVTVVEPDALETVEGNPYRVFTPYWKAWKSAPRREIVPAPGRIALPAELDPGEIPEATGLPGGAIGDTGLRGGETAGYLHMTEWIERQGGAHGGEGESLADPDSSSRLSPWLHFGCVSPVELEQAASKAGLDDFAREICWRDFDHQLVRHFPELPRREFRPRGDRWSTDPERLGAWKEGRTGYPIVDAAMRQLAAEGWMHNRLRMVTASFLTKHLGIDWRAGAAHFMDHLVDGDLVNNSANWQWVAGTGTDTRPNRTYNPVRQAQRFDPDGSYVRKWVPELSDLAGRGVHTPWLVGDSRVSGYPPPIVDHDEAVGAFLERRRSRVRRQAGSSDG